jgi:hypothetical protein
MEKQKRAIRTSHPIINGEKLCRLCNKTKSISAQGAISAYAAAISAMKAQLIYKKSTGSPGRIDFFETE